MTALNLCLAGYQPPQSVHNRAAEIFGAELATRLGDGFSFELDGNVTTRGHKAADILGMVEEGSRSFCYFATSYLAGRFLEISVLDLPFVMTDRERIYRALDGDLGDLLKERVAASSNYRLLGFWDNGFRHITNSIHPIRSPADCTGLKIRTGDSALHQATFRAMGFEPTFIDVKDLPEAVKTGTVDAQDNPLSNIYNFGIHEHHRHLTLSGHFLGFVAVLAHAPSFDAWGDEVQTAISQSLPIATAAQHEFAQAVDEDVLAKLDPAKNEIVHLTDQERAAFASAVAPVVEAESAKLGRELVDLALG